MLARGVRLRDGADELGLQYAVVGVDGGDARVRVRRDDRQGAVQLGQQRIQRDDGGMKVLFVAGQGGVEIAHHVAQVGDQRGQRLVIARQRAGHVAHPGDQVAKLLMALGQSIADDRQVGDDAVQVGVMLVKCAQRCDRLLGQPVKLDQEIVDGSLVALQCAAGLLDQYLQAGACVRVEGAQELVEVDRAQGTATLEHAAALQLGAAVDGGDLDVLLRQQRRVADARRRELMQRRVVRGHSHADDGLLARDLDAGDLADTVTGDHDVGSPADTVGIGEGGLHRVVLPGRNKTEVEGQAEAGVDRRGE